MPFHVPQDLSVCDWHVIMLDLHNRHSWVTRRFISTHLREKRKTFFYTRGESTFGESIKSVHTLTDMKWNPEFHKQYFFLWNRKFCVITSLRKEKKYRITWTKEDMKGQLRIRRNEYLTIVKVEWDAVKSVRDFKMKWEVNAIALGRLNYQMYFSMWSICSGRELSWLSTSSYQV